MNSPVSPSAGRFAFMLAVIPFLIDRGSATIDELAQRFELSPSVVSRLITTIAVSGVPGDANSYLANDLFDIDWDAFERGEVILMQTIAIDRIPRLSQIEISAIIAGLQLLDGTLGATSAAAATSILEKLDVSGERADRATVRHLSDDLRTLRAAIESRHTVQFSYVDARGESVDGRLVDPLWVERYEQAWYLRGWSHSREAVRTFRVDRIFDLVDTGASYEPHPDHVLSLTPDPAVRTATVRVSPTALNFLSWFVDAQRERDTETGDVVAEVAYSSPDALVRSIMSYPGRVRVDNGADVRRAVAERAAAALARYE